MHSAALCTAVLLLLCLGTSSASRHSPCDCQSPFRCPQAYRSGRAQQCRLRNYRLGVCCPRSGGSGHGTSSPLQRNCRPLVLCPAALSDTANFGGSKCRLADGSPGVMCSSASQDAMQQAVGDRNNFGGGAGGSGAQPLSPARTLAESLLVVNAGGDMRQAASDASRSIRNQIELNNRLLTSGQIPSRGSTVGIFNLNFRSTQAVQNLGLNALQGIQTLTNINAQGAAADEMVSVVSRFGDSPSLGGGSSGRPTRVEGCTDEEPIFCTNSQYRTVNGECNNLGRPRQGRALTGFRRLLENTYDDGIFAIRSRSVAGGQQLPSPRLVSERVVESLSQELRGFTLSVMQWGQFIDHDFNHALVFRAGTEAIECCENDGATLPDTPLHPACIPIPIPNNDPFYSQFGQRCMTLVRSLPAPQPDCIARPGTPLNELTSYLDASMLYGSEETQLDGLRTFSGGQLTTTGQGMLPLQSTPRRQPGSIFFGGPTSGGQATEEPEGESCREDATVCYRGGESRVNEQSALTVMHTIFTREHNRIAKALAATGRRWNDEKLFQEARRIVIAEWQHIAYNEWLPIILGFDFARDHALRPRQRGFSNTYDTTVDATASNEFATAAFRFGHSLLRDMYDLINSRGQTVGNVNVTRTFFNPSVVATSLVEHARTLVARRPQTFDSNVIRSVHEQLFTANFRFGLDLIALNIQRGRDHGIPTYADMSQACNGVAVRTWDDLSNLMDRSDIDQLRSVYADPRDVDLFIGGLAERRAPGAQVGPTFQCIIGEQFFDLRFGDRFFYDLGGQPHSFTEEQLNEIRKSSWARIMCDTLGPEFGGDFAEVQPLAFVESGVGPNAPASCNSQAIPRMNLNVF